MCLLRPGEQISLGSLEPKLKQFRLAFRWDVRNYARELETLLP
jgi:hypothetical protein